MKTLEFNRKIHDNDAKLKKGLKRHRWVMGHGWGLHGEHGRWVDGAET
jgi:hypothetical protein